MQVVFAASGTLRAYATHAAPLQRAEFRAGDKVSGSGRNFVVERIEQHTGVLSYFGAGDTLAEGELDDVQDLSKADERLISGRVDRADRFEFRIEALTPARAGAAFPGLGPDVGAHRPDCASIARRRNRCAAGARCACCLPTKSVWAKPSRPA